jgi:hypothetical protein
MIDRETTMFMRAGLTEAGIAEVLRRGPSQAFCNALAMVLDHPARKRPRYVLRLLNKNKNRPKGSFKADMVELGSALLDAAKLPRGEAKRERAHIEKEFGVCPKTGKAAMERERELRELWDWLQLKEEK